MLNLLLFGPPGAGKGTQSDNICRKYGLIHISTGELLRTEIAAETEIGRRIKEDIAAGCFASDETVLGLVEQKFERNPDAKGFVLDGFPRTTAQAVELDKMMARRGEMVNGMIALEVNTEILKQRLADRAKVIQRPEDMDETAVNKRFQIYKETTEPVQEHYKKQDKFYGIDGESSVDRVFETITETIESLSVATT